MKKLGFTIIAVAAFAHFNGMLNAQKRCSRKAKKTQKLKNLAQLVTQKSWWLSVKLPEEEQIASTRKRK